MSFVGKTSQGTSGFSPTSIPDCVLWLDAADSNTLTLSGSNVTAWRDKSGSNYTFLCNATFRAPTYQSNGINSLPALTFSNDGNAGTTVTTVLDSSSATLNNSNYSVFAVANLTAVRTWTDAQYILKGTLNSDSFLFVGTRSSGRVATFTGTSGGWNDTNANTPNTNALNVVRLTGMTVSNTVLTPYYDGNVMSTKTGTTGVIAGMRLGDAGASGQTGQGWVGQIAEILIYSSALSSAQRQAVEGYLGAKWGVTVPAVHPFKRALLGASPFAPTSIPGCVLWLDASDSSTLTLSGSNVTAWRDKSTSSNTVTVVSSGTRPNWNSTRSSVVVGSNGYFTVPLLTVAKEYGFFVYQAYSATQSDFFVGNTNYTRRIRLGGTNADFSTYSIAWIVGPDCNIGGGTSNTNLFRFDTTSRLVRNGGTTSFSGNPLSNATIQTGTLTRLGEFAGQLGGEIMEAVVFQGVDLTTRQINQVESYLANKWGLSASVASATQHDPVRPFMRPFQPIDISGCALWLDAVDSTMLTLSGSIVTQWRDRSGNGHVFSNHVGAPTLSNSIQSGNSAVYLNGSSALNNTTFTLTNTAYSIFTIAYQQTQVGAGGANYSRLLNGGGAANDCYIFLGASTSNYATFTGNGGGWNDIAANTPNRSIFQQWKILGMTVSGSNLTPYIDGSGQNVKTTGTTSAFTGLSVGGAQSGSSSQLWIGYCGELLVYNSVLSAGQRQQVETYLANKWGLRGLMPSNHYSRLNPALSVPFTPPLISNCVLWLDSGDITTITLSGSNVTQWNDKSGNGNNATTISGTPNPTYASNAVQFDGTQALQTSVSASTNVESGFFIVSVPNVTSASTMIAGGGGSRQFRIAGGTIQTVKQANFNVLTTGTSLTNNVKYLIGFTNDGTTLTHYLNGSSYASSAAATYNAGLTTRVGGQGENLTGYMQEIIMFSRSLSTTERQTVEGFMARRWGLTSSLPTSNPYKSPSTLL